MLRLRRPSYIASCRLAVTRTTALLAIALTGALSQTSHAGPIREVKAIGHVVKQTVQGVAREIKSQARSMKRDVRNEARTAKRKLRRQGQRTKQELRRQVRLTEGAALSGNSARDQVREAEKQFGEQGRAAADHFTQRGQSFEERYKDLAEDGARHQGSGRNRAATKQRNSAENAVKKAADARKTAAKQRKKNMKLQASTFRSRHTQYRGASR